MIWNEMTQLGALQDEFWWRKTLRSCGDGGRDMSLGSCNEDAMDMERMGAKID